MAPLGPSRAIILGNVSPDLWYPRLDSGATPQHLYIPETYNDTNNVWEDYMGNGNSTATRGNPNYVSRSAGNGANITECVQGGTGDGLRFVGRLTANTNYTLFHITRYNGSEGRIFNGYDTNWLSGFWSGRTPVAYHNGWLTDQGDRAGTNWVVSVDQYNYYRGYWGASNNYGGTGGGSQTVSVTINYGNTIGEYSAWQCYLVMYYNTALSSAERDAVVNHLRTLVELQ